MHHMHTGNKHNQHNNNTPHNLYSGYSDAYSFSSSSSAAAAVRISISTTFYWRHSNASVTNASTSTSTVDTVKSIDSAINSDININTTSSAINTNAIHKYKQEYTIPNDYDWQRSTEDNYRCCSKNNANANGSSSSTSSSSSSIVATSGGEFSEHRGRLDRSYHATYVPERMALKDSIVASMLLPLSNANANATDHHDHDRHRHNRFDYPPPQQQQWIVFTAGVYGKKSHTIRKLQSLALEGAQCFFTSYNLQVSLLEELQNTLANYKSSTLAARATDRLLYIPCRRRNIVVGYNEIL
mmetsp:Transcript_26942/g.56423  ORF Transcript_26942/g.56423 Transcript_26942/m.56423 type:complete len:298 (-) Transcript_26942:108-1001(-)